MNNNNEIVKIRDYVYEFLYFDKLACHVLAEYYCDLDMILEFQLNNNDEISFDLTGTNLEIDYGNGKSDKYDRIENYTITHKCEKSGKYVVRIKGILIKFSFCSKNIKKVINWNYYLENLTDAFFECTELEEVPDYIPKNITNMYYMFYKCSNFNCDISKWNVQNVLSMSFMFFGCEKFNCDISKWNVQNVQNMSGMFYKCSNLNPDLSNWNVQSVQNMSRMFNRCSNFNLDLSNWNVQSVQFMYGMFEGCSNFNSDLSNWNVQNVQDMSYMFDGCSNFNSNLSNWNVQNVKDMYYMFDGCNILKQYKPKFKN